MAYIPQNSILATQGTVPWSVLGATNQSISGAVSVSNFPANQSISGAISVSNLPTNQNISGSVVAFQGGTWNNNIIGSVGAVIIGGSIATSSPANQSVSGTIHVDNFSSVIATQLAGSVMAVSGSFTPAANQSVSGAVSISNFPTTQNVSGSVVAFPTGQYTVVSSLAGGIFPISGSVAAVITNTTVPISGSVVSFQAGTQITSLVSTVPSSVIVGTSIFGQLPAGTAMLGSVVSTQGTSPWVIQSIVGTYAEDGAHTDSDKGLFILGVRNDAISSIIGAERDYGPLAIDQTGRQITVPFAGQQACIISYFGSIVSGSVQLIQASVIGSRSYITDFWVANTGATTTLLTFQGGDTSILGFTIAPAGGGSNSPGIAIPLRTTLSQDLTFKVSPSTSVLYLTVKGYQSP